MRKYVRGLNKDILWFLVLGFFFIVIRNFGLLFILLWKYLMMNFIFSFIFYKFIIFVDFYVYEVRYIKF